MVDLVGEGGGVGGGGATLNGDVQDLLLLLVQADLVRVVVPVVERLKWKKWNGCFGSAHRNDLS